MDIQRLRRRLQWRKAIMVILWMEAFDMADRTEKSRYVEAVLTPADSVVIGDRPSIRAGDQAHPVRAQHMQFRQRTGFGGDQFQIGISGQKQLGIERLKQFGAALRGVGVAQQRQNRMCLEPLAVCLQDQRQGCSCFGQHLDAAETDRIAGIACARQ